MAAPDENRGPGPSLSLTTVSLLLIGASWILFVGTTRSHEMWVGGAVLLLSGAFLWQVRRVETLRLELHIGDMAQAWRIPWYIASGVWEMIVVLIKDSFGIKRAESLFRVCAFRASETDPRIMARGVLATAFTTTAPNFIVIGIDGHQQRMLFHQVERSSIPRMTQALGAQPGGKQ